MLYTVENTVLMGKRVKVILDGIEQDLAQEADDEDGYVDVIVLDENGCMVIDGCSESIKIERKYGRVEVVSLPELNR